MIRRFIIFAILIAWGAVSPVEGTQHLVSPGESWSDLGPRLKPGDEIILLPGAHRGVRFTEVVGTEEQPIVIRSADPDQPGVIRDQRVGVYLKNCRHFVLRDFSVSHSSLCGIRIENDVDKEAIESVDHGFFLERLRISKIKRGRGRQGIQIIGTTNVRITECTVQDWGGRAIDLKGCAKVVLAGSTFAMEEKRQSGGGILIRKGSSDIQIRRCRLKDAGAWAIQLGESDADSAVRDILMADTLVIGSKGSGGGCRLERVENGILRRNSFVNLRGSILEIAGSAASIRSIRFKSNLISWSGEGKWIPGAPISVAKGGEVLPRESLMVRANLWWDGQRSPDQPVPELPLIDAEPQVWDIDPDLDGKDYSPRNLRAGLYGISQK